MADEPDLTDITIRHKDTGQERTVTKHAAQFFPDWERVDTQGRRVAATHESPKE